MGKTSEKKHGVIQLINSSWWLLGGITRLVNDRNGALVAQLAAHQPQVAALGVYRSVMALLAYSMVFLGLPRVRNMSRIFYLAPHS